MTSPQAADAARSRFGRPQRTHGSGVSYLEWDVAGGTLTVCEQQGIPTFRTAAGRVVRLIDTTSPAADSLFQRLEMTTPPDPDNHGTRFYFGTVEFRGNGTYQFNDSGTNVNDRGTQSGNFFVRHPAGRVAVAWSPGVTPRTPLDGRGDGEVARLTLTAADDPAATTVYAVVSLAARRRLEISGPTFRLGTVWAEHRPGRSRP